MGKYLVDILMITYKRPEYTKIALERLLETAKDNHRIWVWHNGEHEETLEVVKAFKNHPRLYRLHHSQENIRLREPTNWFWKNSDGKYLGKVDDDGYVSEDWIDKICEIHEKNEKLGIIGSWHFHIDDFDIELAQKKMIELKGGSALIQNCWVSGNGYIMKRECQEDVGFLENKMSFFDFCMKSSTKRWKNGWLYPLVTLESMDDPRSQYTILKTNADLYNNLPLSALSTGVDTLEKWQMQLKKSAETVLKASPNYKEYVGFRSLYNKIYSKLKILLGVEKKWNSII